MNQILFWNTLIQMEKQKLKILSLLKQKCKFSLGFFIFETDNLLKLLKLNAKKHRKFTLK